MRRLSLAVVTALVLTACGGGGDGPDDAATRGSTTTTTSTATTPTSGTGAPDPDAGAASGDGGGGGQAAATPTTLVEAPPAPKAAGAARPAAPGTYEYDTDGRTTRTGAVGGTEELPSRTTLKVDPADGGRQRSARDMRDAEGNGNVTTTVLQYRDDGVFLESLTTQTTVSGATFTYDFRPDPAPLVAPTGVGVGYHTEFTVTSTNGGLQATVAIDVLDEETVTIGGTAVETVKARLHTEFEGDAEGESTSDVNVDAARYLVVREHAVSDLRSALGNFHTEQTSVLRSLDPR